MASIIVFRFYKKAIIVEKSIQTVSLPTVENSSDNFKELPVKSFYNSPETRNTNQKPFCDDKQILPIWKVLLKDKGFKDWQEGFNESVKCQDLLETKEIDLNIDGKKEILLRGKNFNLCSAVGNCAFWVYEKKGNSFQKLLYSTDYIDISKLGEQLLKTKTNGYKDILLKGHFTASDTTYRFYKFNGQKYKLVKDLISACSPCSGDQPKWKMMTWKEYQKLNH